MTGRVRARAWAALLLAACVAAPAWAQQSREAERRLEAVRKELREVAGERRKLESERGAAARRLREADEQVARSARALEATTAELHRQQAALEDLSQQRDALRTRMSAQRDELRALLRASYTAGEAAPLKLLLAQDQLADAGRALTYQRYLQRQRAARIAALGEELSALEALEREVRERQAELERTREAQRSQMAALERDRKAREAKIIGDGAVPPSLADPRDPAGFAGHGIPTEGAAGGLSVKLTCSPGPCVLARLGRIEGEFVLVAAKGEVFVPDNLEQRKLECGIPFWPHAFVKLDDAVDIDTLLEYYMNEYGVLGYGEHLVGELRAFCEVMGIRFVEA